MGFGRILGVIMILSFTLGFMASMLVTGNAGINTAAPLSDWLAKSPERDSPFNWVSEENILVYDDRVVLMIDDPYWSNFMDTNSMDPLLDEEANAIQITPNTPSDIHVGDVISYRTTDGVIIHRVKEIGTDGRGWYAITRGDNNAFDDPAKVRFSQVERVLVAVIY